MLNNFVLLNKIICHVVYCYVIAPTVTAKPPPQLYLLLHKPQHTEHKIIDEIGFRTGTEKASTPKPIYKYTSALPGFCVPTL